tara:strand:+ start:10800 stop:11795 length:996 start_codon:yes stop_codon:yes gene_type:complete
MSSIDDIINNIINETSNIEFTTEEIKENDLTEKQAENLEDKIENLNKKAKSTKQQLKKGNITEKEAKDRAKKYKQKLNKYEKTTNNKPKIKIGKAQPRPPNDNPNNVRCFMRYNNQGNLYRVCDSGGKKTKPPAQITPPISPEEFLNKINKGYSELTPNQTKEYHRLDMANRRFDERQQLAPIQDTLESVLQEQRRLGGFVAKEQKLEETIKREKLKKELNDRKLKYRAKTKNLNKIQKANMKEQILKEVGLDDASTKKFRKAGLKIGRDPKPKKKGNIQQNINELKKELDKTQENIIETKEGIKDGKKVITKFIPTTLTKEKKKVKIDLT